MSNVTIYLDDELEERLRQAAKDEGVSVSKLVSKMIAEKTVNHWPMEFMNLAGSWSDLDRPAFAGDLPRESL
jgi:predicted transcriptional regulator